MIELERKRRRLSKQAVESYFSRSRRHDNLLLISQFKCDIASQDGDRNNEILDPAIYIINESEGWKSHSPVLYLLLRGFADFSRDLGQRVFSRTKRKRCSPAKKHFLLQLKPCFIFIHD